MLVWDPANTNNAGLIDPGDGNWDTTANNLVWNNGSGNVAWTQTSTTASTNGAIFGGTNGNYTITLDASQIAVTNLTFTNSGYTLAGTFGIYNPGNSVNTIAAGVTATINCPLVGGNNGVFWQTGSNSTLVVGGNMTGSQQPRFLAPGSFYFGGVNTLSVPYILAPVFQTNGSFTTSASFFIGYNQSFNGVTYNTGTFTLDGPSTTFAHTGGDSLIGRAGGTGTFVIRNGATASIGPTALRHLRIAYDNNGNNHGTLDVQDGTLNVGTSSLLGQIIFGGNGAPAGLTAVMTQEGGTVNAYGGITFGGTAGGTGGTASLTMSGGSLYLGSVGISEGTIHPTETITLSGGTVGAWASWSSVLPLTLAMTNGDVTFQCSDPFGTPYNISLTMPLTGAGGLKKSGSGILTLSGTNTYAGSTTISNGTLVMTAATFSTNGPVTLDGSAGSPTASVKVTNPGQYWSIGTLTFVGGTPTADFQFGALSPSTSVAPIQVSGNVAFTVTPNVNVGGTAIAAGTYPLIHYTGTVSGTLPVNVTLPGYATGHLSQITATKTIALVVTSSTYNPALSWRVGNGIWDINTTSNWMQFGAAATYTDGSAVIFDDTASGSSPITVTLNTIVNPLDVTANNSVNKSYLITGSGSIAGTGNLELLGSGALTLAGTNTYSGGTIVSAGQLNINNGGNATGTAIGTGPLTLNAGATLDNTSGTNVNLQANISENWNGNFTFLGSNNLNTGPGIVNLNANLTVQVNSNAFMVGSLITDNGQNYKLTKAGNGALTLLAANAFNGGLTLSSGLLNVGDNAAAGSGTLTLDGGSIDNVSGQDLTLTPSSIFLGAGFTFVGTTNLDLGTAPAVFDTAAGTPVLVNALSNTLMFEGVITLGNNALVKNGNGALSLSGFSANGGVPLTVNAGRVNLDKTAGNAIGAAPVGVTVNTNGLLVITGSSGDQIHDSSGSATPVRLVGGTFDLNGNSERVDNLTLSFGGTVRNSAASQSILSVAGNGFFTLADTNAFFAVDAADGVLQVASPITGVGSLVKTGAGLLNLSTNNTYTGNTILTAGALALVEPGSISNSAAINLGTGTTLDVTPRFDQTLTLASGQTLMGNGSLNGNLVALPGSTVSPGAPVGTLRVTNNVTLGGNLLLGLNRSNTPSSSKLVSDLGTITYGGTLTVTNVGPALQAGNTFQLFPSKVTAFSAITLAATDANHKLYTWSNKVAVDGSIQVLTVQDLVNTTPTNIAFAVSGNTLTLSWPADHLGWTLKTNAVGLTATNAWFPYPGSASVTTVSVTISPANTNVFFRLVYP
jgi:autotransporter-associated beta strand protein